jgi:hypothetical protein
MAIEVIERGGAPADKVYEAACPQCKSRLRFSRSDARFIADQRDGDCVNIICPVCTHDIYVAA